MTLHASDLETWFLARGWIIVAVCFGLLALALAVLATNSDDGQRTCPPVDLDTELRKLIDDEKRKRS